MACRDGFSKNEAFQVIFFFWSGLFFRINGRELLIQFGVRFGHVLWIHLQIGNPRRQVPQKIPRKVSFNTRPPGKRPGKRLNGVKLEVMVGKSEILNFCDFGALRRVQDHFCVQNRRCSCAAHNVLNPNGL